MRQPLAAEEADTVSTANDPLDEAIRRADLRALWLAIEELPHKQRDAILLREFGGMSYGELSAALAVSGSAVESLLFRARDGLRGKLRAVYGAVTGASWIEAIVRVAVGGGAPAAAKVAVLGLGAAAVGGGAVVVPHAFDNHRPSHGPLRTPATAVVRRPKAPAPHELVSRVVTAPASPAPVHTVLARKDDSSKQEAEHHAASHDAGRSGDDDQGRPVALPAAASGRGSGGNRAHERGADAGGGGQPGKAGKTGSDGGGSGHHGGGD